MYSVYALPCPDNAANPKRGTSTLMDLPILLLLCPKSRQRPISTLHSGNFDNNEAHKVRQRPVATMRTKHIQILDAQRPTAAREEVVDLAIVVEEEHASFGNLLAREVVSLQFHIGGQFIYCCGSLGCGGAC